MSHSISAHFNLIRTITKAASILISKSSASICIVFAVSIFASNAYAEAGKTVLVMDASGSMWGKIEDGYKIRVARNVVNGLLKTLPADQEIGLVTYGHRATGDCDDIELMVPPAAGTRDAISAAIESLDPKGRTPLSASVIKAADSLGLDANDATVILISDGEETCFMDPCAVTFELEKRGIDFVAHVVGFDVEEAADQAQLSCLAENTGGLFFSASNEAELTSALNKISLAMAEAAKKVQLNAIVQDHENKPVGTGIAWTLAPTSSTGVNAATAKTNLLAEENRTAEELQEALDPGRYTLSVTRDSDGVSTSLDVDLTNSEDAQFVLTLPPKASIEGPITVTIGEIFEVEWEGPGAAGDLIAVASSLSPTAQIIGVFGANSAKTTIMRAPTEPGEYQLRYVYAASRSVIATSVLNVEEIPTTLSAPNEANAGYLVAVDWEGPNETHDAIVVAEVGSADTINKTVTDLGNPALVQMPSKPGNYEIRYVLHQDRKVLASQLITVIDGAIELNAPEEAGVGYSVNVDWVGPDAKHDTVVVAKIGAIEHINKTDTYLGNPAKVQMPTEPGEYELRYILHNGSAVMATRTINVIDGSITIDAPEEALVGDSVTINWVGPGETHDVIAVAEMGAIENINETGAYLGNPAKLQMPTKPGNYEIRYVLHQGQTVMASQPITVSEVEVLLVAPNEADAGTSIMVHWVGPDEQNDVIAIAKVGDTEYINETRTDSGNRLELQMPAIAGNYELRYVLYQDRTILATRPISVNSAEVVTNAPNDATVDDSTVVE